MISRQRSWSCLSMLVAVVATRGAAESALDRVPDSAMGVVVVRNLAATNAKIERFLQIFAKASDAPVPAPLTLLQVATGLGSGLNLQGDAAMAALAGDALTDPPRPLLVIPVGDYGAFARSINGDASGEICRVTIAGEDVLAAKSGGYAVLMNVEHRAVLEGLLASPAAPPAALAVLSDWLQTHDAAAVLLPRGVAQLIALGKANLVQERASMEAQFADRQFAATLQQTRQLMDLYDAVLGFWGGEVEAAGVGLAIDDATNVRLSGRLLVGKAGKLAAMPVVPPPVESPLSGHVDGPFVAVAGGPVPEGAADWAAKLGRRLFEKLGGVSGFESFTESDWQEWEDTYRAKLDALQAFSAILRPGEKDEPILSNAFAVLKVTDAAAYLRATRKSYELGNALLERSTSDLKGLTSECAEGQVGGKPALIVTTDVAKATDDPRVTAMEPWMKSLFGADGKTRTYFVVRDAHLVVSGADEKAGMATAVDQAADQGLAKSSLMLTTTALLDKQAPWQAAVSPQGCVQWFSRLVAALFSQLGGQKFPVPAYPDSPPVGFSVRLGAGQAGAEMVWPVDALKQLAAYIEICKNKK